MEELRELLGLSSMEFGVDEAEQVKQRIQRGAYDDIIAAFDKRRKQLMWEKLPEQIILIRHGESEGNVDHTVYSTRGDSQLELTPDGFRQAKAAGKRLKALVGDDRIFAAVSPFERTQQTLYGLYLGGFPRQQVGVVHHDPRIREQEFGNFQNPGLTATVRVEEQKVGRFYYRRPNAESSSDVFDRVSAFWDALLSEGPGSLLLERTTKFGTCLLVTHGLTIRLLLMAIFQWSVDTFETVHNIGNCEHIMLRKNSERCCYELQPERSYPPRIPWATRNVWVRLKALAPSENTAKKLQALKEFRNSPAGVRLGALLSSSREADEGGTWAEVDRTIDELEAREMRECSQPFTVVDYLTIKPPRSMQHEEAIRRMIRGHNQRGTPEELMARAGEAGLTLDDVVSIDWWGDRISYRAKVLRMKMDKSSLVSTFLDVSPGGRVQLSTPSTSPCTTPAPQSPGLTSPVLCSPFSTSIHEDPCSLPPSERSKEQGKRSSSFADASKKEQ